MGSDCTSQFLIFKFSLRRIQLYCSKNSTMKKKNYMYCQMILKLANPRGLISIMCISGQV